MRRWGWATPCREGAAAVPGAEGSPCTVALHGTAATALPRAAQVAVGDINGDGALELVAVDARGNVAALAPDGTELWERHVRSLLSQARALAPATRSPPPTAPPPVPWKPFTVCMHVPSLAGFRTGFVHAPGEAHRSFQS